MPSLTRRKFEEAQYFLSKCQELARRPNAPFVPEVLFYLSALISAARSVLWVMRHEYNEVPGWEQWFQSRNNDSTGEALFKRFTGLRNETVKTGTLQPHFVPLILPTLSKDPSLPPKPTFAVLRVGTSGDRPLIVEGADLEWVIDLDGREVLFSAAQYVSLLSEIVGECEARFSVA